MKQTNLLLTATLLGFRLLASSQSAVELNNWKFQTGDNPEWAKPEWNDTGWSTIQVGSYWETQGYSNYNGYAWYRIRFTLPENLKKSAVLKDSILFTMGKIDNCDQTFLNGKLLGENGKTAAEKGASPVQNLATSGGAWNTLRTYTLPATDSRLKWNQENVLSVRVYDKEFGGGIYTQPLSVRMKTPADYLDFDINSQSFNIQSDGTITKSILLKNHSASVNITGILKMDVIDSESRHPVATQTFRVKLKKGVQTFTLLFKGNFSQRQQATYSFTEFQTGTVVFRTQALPFFPNTPGTDVVSGAYYNWAKTMQPETPWKHDYNKTLVIKISSGAFSANRWREVLKAIRRIDNLTLGLPKIAYLVGWINFDPGWDKTQKHFVRDTDPTALDSLKWFMKQAKDYHTTISLHTNLIDIFEDTPFWQEYLDKDIVAKDNQGEPIKGESWGGPQSCQLSYAQEWKLGYTQKRIDNLLNMLPELKESGTIHIDAFHSMRPSGPGEPMSPYLGLTIEEEMEAQRKIIRYYQKQGLDVTCEGGMYFLRKDPFIGLQSAAWWTNEAEYIANDFLHKPKDFHMLPVQFAGCTPMHCEEEINKNPEKLPGLLQQFCLRVVPWYYRRNADVASEGTVIITHDKVICPVLWKNNTMIAYDAQNDISEPVKLPDTWVGVKNVQLSELTINGLQPETVLKVTDGIIHLTIPKNQPIVITPVNQ